MRLFLVVLAAVGVIVAVVGLVGAEAWMVLVGVAALVVALVMLAQGVAMTRGR